MKLSARIALAVVILLALAGIAGAQSSWTALNNQPPIGGPGVMLQLRDGRILVHDDDATDWVILTPDATGSYVNGTWSSGGDTSAFNYCPLYFGSQVLLNGRQVVIQGGEYNCGSADWQTTGAVGTVTPWGGITWAYNAPPTGWSTVGDAESIILANGHYMQANCCTAQNAIFQGPSSWLATGNVKQPNNDESAFTLLTNNLVLTVDAKNDAACGGTGDRWSELYNQGTGTWTCGSQTPIRLYNPADEELGAAILMYNNKVFQSGGNVVATAIYDVASNTWSAGPTPPNGLDQADGPSALEPNGKVLAMYSPGLFNTNCQFMEYNPTSNTLSNTSNGFACPNDSSYYGHLMILPSGNIMFTDFGVSPVAIYTPPPGVVASAVPTILAASTSLKIGSVNNVLYGRQLNGLTQNNGYGDDYQGDTDFPLVRLTNTQTGNVYYAFTHDDSTHSIAPGTISFTYFDLPATIPAGKYSLQSVANGIGSNSIIVSVK